VPTRNVGAPDPALKNSPIMEPVAQEEPPPVVDETESANCHFNDEQFPHGTYVQSGDQVLRCERGAWVVAGPEAAEVP
jgi:hypothetical protein